VPVTESGEFPHRLVRALHRKKERQERGKFLIEGEKCVQDLLASGWPVDFLAAAPDWTAPADLRCPLYRVDAVQLQRVSALQHSPGVLAVAPLPPAPPHPPAAGKLLALDGIRDPGNFGTLLRIADWFGLDGLVCSPDCVEATNPKAVQASMGSLFRIPVHSLDLNHWLAALPNDFWRAGTFLSGESVHAFSFPAAGVLVLGHESQGIRPETTARLNCRLTIPGGGGAESLNVAAAAAVCCACWTRP